MPDGVDAPVDAVEGSRLGALSSASPGYALASKLIEGDNATLARRRISDPSLLLHALGSTVLLS